MATLRDYYDAEFNYAFSVHRDRSFGITGGGNLVVHERLHLDFRANAKFISYFIPEIQSPVELCRYILEHPEWGLSLTGGVFVSMGEQDEVMKTQDRLVFTGQFAFYIDRSIDPESVRAIIQAAAEKSFVAVVREHEYVARKEKLALAALAEKVAEPQALEALANSVAEFEKLLEEANREEEAHHFLKANPTILGLTSVSDPISKLPLGSEYVTDFVLNEVPYGYILVEIEKATARLFKKTSPPERTQELNHAIEQVEHWRAWIGRNHSYISSKLPGISPTPLCWIIAGRSNEMSPEQSERLAQINEQHRGVYAVLTYDDLLTRLKGVLNRLRSTASQQAA